MNVVIWSKNRACQLDLFLRSIEKYWHRYNDNTFKILYNYDNADFKKGYDVLMEEFKWPKYLAEISFKQDILTSILDDSEYIGLFCDDDVFTERFEWNKGIMMNPSILSISLCSAKKGQADRLGS